MASGLPVIAAPAGGVADHLRHGENGLAYPPKDARALAEAMAMLVRDRPLRRRLAAGARATAESLSWDAELDRLDQSYRELVVQARERRHAGQPVPDVGVLAPSGPWGR
jgi:glycosyltransferase involved in cell wall biosynthesis